MALCLGAASLGVLGCSSDDGEKKGPGTGSGPLYLLATNFSAGDQAETYLVTTSTFDASTVIDPTSGPKLLGGVVPVVRDGAVFVPDANGPVLVRYDVGAGDQLEKRGELSFAGVGMTEIMSWHVYTISATKGYVFDPRGSRIIVWNPTTMELTGKQIELAEALRDGWSPQLVFEHSGPRLRGTQLLVPLGWQDQDGNSRFASGLVVLDTVTDELVSVDEDERCGESYATVESPEGDISLLSARLERRAALLCGPASTDLRLARAQGRGYVRHGRASRPFGAGLGERCLRRRARR
ncbi:MAG: hypothetical protein QM756_09135 [Polyangiaceae bacterium]